jgi:lipoate-protein ligase A
MVFGRRRIANFCFCLQPPRVRPWLTEISLFDDPLPRSAPLNMAIDEALLGTGAGPVLRVYRWKRPAVSFGYFERWAPIHAAHPDREAVRRWTGGGVVLHGEDVTYSLLVPGASPPPSGTYALIHGALRAALAGLGIVTESVTVPSQKTSHACFENPVCHDVILRGKKIAGAAQRRTRLGLIHQGSIQGLDLPAEFPATFAAHLAGAVRNRSFDVIPAAEKLAAEKYAAPAWLERR